MIFVIAATTSLLSADPSTEKKADDATTAAIKALKLPGIEINLEEHSVDVQSAICLTEGALEFIACTKDTKEHESIIVVNARPLHIHTALLLLGAKNGNPSMRRALDKEFTRWQDIPPSGDPVEVFLVWKNDKEETVDRPISDFITRSQDAESTPADPTKKEEKQKFPHTFLFAGSQLGDPAESPRKYYADISGHVISISAFGDELLCLPEVYSQENGALMWQIDPTHVPPLHTKVTLRLRVKKPKP